MVMGGSNEGARGPSVGRCKRSEMSWRDDECVGIGRGPSSSEIAGELVKIRRPHSTLHDVCHRCICTSGREHKCTIK